MSSVNSKKRRRYNYGICIDCGTPVRDKGTKRCIRCFDIFRRSPQESQRQCRECRRVLPIDRFGIRPKRGTHKHTCSECELKRLREWKKSDAGQQAEKSYLAGDKYREYRKQYEQSEHRKKHRRESNKRRRNTPEGRAKGRIYCARRRARLAAATGKFDFDDWCEVLARQNNKCYYCGKMFSDELPPTIDHYVPLSLDGAHDSTNIVAACRPCNGKKWTKTGDEYLQIIRDSHAY